MYLFLCTLRCTVHLCFWIHASYICFFLIDCGLDSAPYNAIRQVTVFVPTERVIRVALTCTNKVFLRCNLTWSLSRMPMLYSFGICERPTLRWRRCIELISGCFLLYVVMPKCPVVGGHARKMVAKLLSHPTAKESMVNFLMVQYDTQVFIHRAVITVPKFYPSWFHGFRLSSCFLISLEQKTDSCFCSDGWVWSHQQGTLAKAAHQSTGSRVLARKIKYMVVPQNCWPQDWRLGY